MSRYRLTIQKMLAENRSEAIADIMTELIRANILATATVTAGSNLAIVENARFDWRNELKMSIANQLGRLFYDDKVITYKEIALPNRVEIEGTMHVLRLGKL